MVETDPQRRQTLIGKHGIHMAILRIDLSEPDRRHIIARSGGRCNKCRIPLFLENDFGEKARLGDDAHIVAASEDGPRGESGLNAKDRASSRNVLLLCKNCHAEADQQPKKYTVATLLRMRDDHYAWADQCMSGIIIKRPRFHYLSYINVPRADMYAAATSIMLPQLSFGSARSIRDMGIDAGRLMAGYVGVLNREDLYANEFIDETQLADLSVGSYWFSDEAVFRSKKVRDGDIADLPTAWRKQECVIYRQFKDWRLICMIDPRWMTTTTASVMLSSGILKTMALVHINSLDHEKRLAWASPIFLGAADKGWSF